MKIGRNLSNSLLRSERISRANKSFWTSMGLSFSRRLRLLTGFVLCSVSLPTLAPSQSVTGTIAREAPAQISGRWAPTGSLNSARETYTATLLPNGQVLVTGGFDGLYLTSAALYDPASGTWIPTANLNDKRTNHTATLLPDGKVLVVGGYNSRHLVHPAEVYDPANGTWAETGSLGTGRSEHTATLLPDGKVLVTGGGGAGGVSITSAGTVLSREWDMGTYRQPQ